MTNFFFLFLCSLLCLLSYYTIIIQNPINAVLSLIGCFLVLSCLLFFFGLNFFAVIILTIYIGAVAVLFLAVLFFINLFYLIKREVKFEFFLFFLFFCFVGFFFFNCFLMEYLIFFFSQNYEEIPKILYFIEYKNSLELLSSLLYVYGRIFFLYAGLLLYITLISVIYIIFFPSIKID